jgi:hypothetical protein
MNLFNSIIKQFSIKDLPKPVGRWRIENCNMQMNKKIDLSNEDHCGPCGQYALEITNNTNTNKKKNINIDLEKQK